MKRYTTTAIKYRPSATVSARSHITAARKIARNIHRKWNVRLLTPLESELFLGQRYGVEHLAVMLTDENGIDVPETEFLVSYASN